MVIQLPETGFDGQVILFSSNDTFKSEREDSGAKPEIDFVFRSIQPFNLDWNGQS